MALRPIWRGHLRLALVSCPVALYNARHDRAGIRFNLINPDTGNRIRMITQDGETGQELERRSLVKGYEFRKGKYLLLSDDDLDSVKVDSSKVMTIEKFVDTASIDPVYYNSAYFLVSDGDAGKDVYAVLREAIADTGKTALSRVVIAQRERTIALRPMGDGLMAHTLYEERDLNSSQELFDDLAAIKTDPEMCGSPRSLCSVRPGNTTQSLMRPLFAQERAAVNAGLFLDGLLGDERRKTGWMRAEAAGDPGPWRQQALLGRDRWDADALRDMVREYVMEHLADDDAVLVVDETGFLKQGKASCGVARQYTGSAGKITNCQIGVFATYVSRHGHAFIDRRSICQKVGPMIRRV